MKDLNRCEIKGKIFDYKVHPMTSHNSVVGEGVIEYRKCFRGRDDKFYEIPIRWYGKDAEKLAKVPSGTTVILKGALSEDLRVNSKEPDKMRSKIYLDIKSFRTEDEVANG